MSGDLNSGPFWIVGCGAMAGAMLSRWLDTGLDPARVTVIDPGAPSVGAGVRVLDALPDEAAPSLLLLGVKPQMLGDVAAGVAKSAGSQTVLLSILAGVRVGTLTRTFPDAGHVVRIMPNLPVVIGEGVVALHAPSADHAALTELMIPLGLVEWIEDEGLFDAVTALSSSGPAFVYRYAQALAQGGVALGLASDVADRLARATVAGAAALAKAAPQSLAALADRVASKGGSTREGLNVLDADGGLDALVLAALAAAEARNRALANPG